MSGHTATPTYGDADLYRESIATCAGSIGLYAETVTRYAALRDDAGLAYGLRAMAAHLRAGLSLLGDLQELNARRAEGGPAPALPREHREWTVGEDA